MSEPLIKTLFVFIGLLLVRRLMTFLSRARFAARLFLHAVMGLAGLLMANAVGGLFGLGLGLNPVTLPVAAGLGLPGVAALWVLRYVI